MVLLRAHERVDHVLGVLDEHRQIAVGNLASILQIRDRRLRSDFRDGDVGGVWNGRHDDSLA